MNRSRPVDKRFASNQTPPGGTLLDGYRKVRSGSFVGRSGTRDGAKKLEALANVDGVRSKEDEAFISFFPPFNAQSQESQRRNKTG